MGGGGGGGVVPGRGASRGTRSVPPLLLRGRPRAVHAYRYLRPATSLTLSEAVFRAFRNALRRPAIENDRGRRPRFEMRNSVRPGRAVRTTLHARSVIVTATRAGVAVPPASATPGDANAQNAAAATAARGIRSISTSLVGTVRPIWSPGNPQRGEAETGPAHSRRRDQ